MIRKECFTKEWIETARCDAKSSAPSLLSTVSNKLNKLSGILPEAFHYWALISQLLATDKH